MDVNFFELKYLITDSFYEEALNNGYSYGQAAGICYEAFFEYISSNNIESIISISTIIILKLRHKEELSKYDIEDMKKILDLSKKIDFKKRLNDSEIEYLEEDIDIVECKYKELVK
ncbi:hypothetical protein R9X47_02365 [Wukongibacter baidiensis]|uniref:hypothetical protein n=1 Tax=Wukongibacter baidiensis TaxID=1723361 RepID=UPI003D7F225E